MLCWRSTHQRQLSRSLRLQWRSHQKKVSHRYIEQMVLLYVEVVELAS